MDISTPFEEPHEDDDLGTVAPVPRLTRRGTKGADLLSGVVINSTELLNTEGLEESGGGGDAPLEHRRLANPFYPALAVRCFHLVVWGWWVMKRLVAWLCGVKLI